MPKTAENSTFYGIGCRFLLWGGEHSIVEIPLTTGVGKIIFDGKPQISDPEGKLTGYRWGICLFGKHFTIKDRVVDKGDLHV